MRTIKLYGELGKKYGRVHRYDVKSVAEAIRALSSNFKEFKKDLMTAHERGVGYKIRNSRHELSEVKEISQPAGKVISFTPVVIGANAESRILIGIAIIAAVIISGGSGAPGAAGYFASVGTGIGVSLVLGGVVQLLSPVPKVDTDGPNERPENTPSYAFNGPVNTTAQGHPVPVGYGRLIVGGAVISAGISLSQLRTGFKKVKTTMIREVYLIYGTNDLLSIPDNGPVPANWYHRVSTGVFEGGFGIPKSERYNYYYYEWVLEPL